MSFNLIEFQEKVKDTLYPDGIDLVSLIKDHSVDEEKLNKYIQDFDNEDRKAIRYIVESIKHISWKEFNDNLFNIANRIKTQIGRNTYGFLLPDGSQYHSEYFFTCYVYEHIFKGKNEPVFCGFEKNTHNIVYVDDGSYTGSQLVSYLKGVFKDIINPFTNNVNDLPIYVTKEEVDLPLTDTDYFITIEPNGNRIKLYTKKRTYYYTRITFLNLFDDVLRIQTENPDIKRIKIPELKILYLNKKLLRYSLSEIKLYLCIPYMSKIAKEALTGLEIKFPTIKVIYPDITDYRIYNIIEKSPEGIKERVKHLFKLYSRLLPSLDYVFPIYFDHKMASTTSTLSVILGCGIAISSKKLLTDPNAAPTYRGPIIKNCTIDKKEIDNIFSFLVDMYLKREKYNKKYNEVCSFCPKPIYTFTNEELKSYHKSL